MTAAGKVSAVTADSITVKGKDGEWTFGIDKATTVVAKGASHKMAAMKADKKPSMVTDYVSVGDDVSVRYHDMGSSKHAATVTVRTALASESLFATSYPVPGDAVSTGVAANAAPVPRLSRATKQETTKRMSDPFFVCDGDGPDIASPETL